MHIEQVPNLNWPRNLYSGSNDRHTENQPADNGFHEDADDMAETEQLTPGDKPAVIVRFRYREDGFKPN